MSTILTVQTFDTGGITRSTTFKKLYADVDREEIIIICLDELITPAGTIANEWKITATNFSQVPVVNQANNPVLNNMGMPKRIGEYDMWVELVFRSNRIALKDAINAAIQRYHGLTNDPLVFIDLTA